jgi:Putative F0F1-ATPase subunit Ca2+/Mg2+ transporter
MVLAGERCFSARHRGLKVDKERPTILQFAGIGMLNALCLGIGLIGGYFVDQALGTLPLFLFIGMILGIAGGVMATRSEIKRFF